MPGVRITRIALIVVGLIALAVYPFAVGTGATNIGGVIALNAIVVLSLVVLTGWAGQVSLGQYAFVGDRRGRRRRADRGVGVPFWFAVPAATLIVAALAALIGLPALRIQGLFLPSSTFAFAAAVHRCCSTSATSAGCCPRRSTVRRFFFFDFEDERSMYFLCVVALVGAAVVVIGNLRRTASDATSSRCATTRRNVAVVRDPAVRTKLSRLRDLRRRWRGSPARSSRTSSAA